jgi:hypothetical protein
LAAIEPTTHRLFGVGDMAAPSFWGPFAETFIASWGGEVGGTREKAQVVSAL